MSLSLYNTLTRRQEPFAPLDPDNVRMYVCGPTVYDRAHIGNARPVVVFDVLYRLLRLIYGADHVTYVRNITDVDDKIMAAAKERSVAIDKLTADTTAMFHDDMAALGALPPDVEPRATRHIPQMIRMIEALIASGHAYAAEGHVLFAVPSMPTYGKLSRRSLKEMIAGARVEVAPYKKDPADFVLWKPSTPEQPGWDSPWGHGRPGWHIECSAMSEAHLGETFDIHGGGLDLIFPHHENEIAQSVCAHHGKPFVRVWMHNGFLSVNGEKMSKSLGNFFTVRELLDKAPGEAIRLFLLKAQYRAPLDFTEAGLREVKTTLDRWYRALQLIDEKLQLSAYQKASSAANPASPPRDLLTALEDDLNTPRATAAINYEVDDAFKALDSGDMTWARMGAETIRAGGALLGLLQDDPEAWFKWRPEGGEGLTDAAVEDLIARRIEAKKARNFAEADRIRDDLKAKGVALEDTPQGTKWRRA